MNGFCKKLLSATLAAAMSFSLTGVMPRFEASALELGTYEAEDLTLDGCTVWTDIYGQQFPGYSGAGFVYHTGGTITLEVEAPEAGMYEISARVLQILDAGGRNQALTINGVKYDKKLMPYADTWTDYSFGKFRLNEGTNVIQILNEYGYGAYDTITVQEAVMPELVGNSETCDPDATPETKALLKYLASVYGEHILSGQQEIYGGGSEQLHQSYHSLTLDTAAKQLTDSAGNVYTYDEADIATADDGSTFVWKCYDAEGNKFEYDSSKRTYKFVNYNYEFDYINSFAGDYPAIRGFDLMNYNPMYGWDDGSTERLIDWVTNKNGIATVCWHINIPKDFENYTVGEPVDWSAATYGLNDQFKVANVVTEGTKEYEYFQLCIEDLAEQLLKAQEAGAPIMFRPFHEAEGNGGLDGAGAWFWWAQDGAEDYKAMWKFLYEELTVKYGLHNLIWVQNLYNWSPDSAQWYAGDEYVDIVGLDKYNTVYNRHDGLTSGPNLDAESGIFYGLYDHVDGKKMVAMPENSTVPGLDNMLIEKAAWLYFCVWYDNGQDNFISGDNYQNIDELTKVYTSDYCITLGELPADLYSYSGEDISTTETTDNVGDTSAEETTDSSDGQTKTLPGGDVNLNGEVTIVDVIMLNKALLGAETLTANNRLTADVDANGSLTNDDSLLILKRLVRLVDEFPEVTITINE